ncbi:hypothetical protein [Anaerotignum sp.]|uniref:hypothetical protein n=1 Tax=Anaerotignum sp. TaxID=2039241 RepID=UPI0028ACAD80|nr:hypothetical protein [Anaerotignum sp.]
MNYHKKQAMKKKILAAVALVMAIIMILSLIAPFTIFAAPVTQVVNAVTTVVDEENQVDETIDSLNSFGNDQFSVEIQAGFDENYIVRKAMPVRGVITNHGDAFRGEVQVKAYTRAINDSKEYAIYYQKLDLEQGASKSIDMEVTMGNIHKYLEMSLVDEKGNIVFQDYKFLTAKDPSTVMIGVLSESPQDLKYFNNLHLAQMEDDSMEYGGEFSKNYDFPLFLDEESFPRTVGVLNSFSVLVVDDFDFSVLSDQQLDAIQQWVLGGGTLVVGTGAAAQKTLKGLNFLSDIQLGGTTVVPGLKGVVGEVALAQLKGDRLQNLKLEGENALFSAIEVGQGQVVISHFSLSSAPMAGQSETLNMLQEVLRQVAESSFIVTSYDKGGNYDRLRYIAGDFPPFEMSSVYLIIGAIIVYILVAGPVMYFILKKKDKREKGWVLVPLLSFVFMGLIFLLAQSSTYKNGLMNTVAYVEMQPGTTVAKADIGMALKSSGKGDVVFTADEKMPVTIEMDDYYYSDDPKKEKCAYRISCGDTTEVNFVESPSWGTQYFRSQSSVDLGGGIESTVIMKDEKFVGEIINHTNVDFYRIALVLNGYLQEFDALAAGETLKIDISTKNFSEESWLPYRGYNYEEIRNKVANGELTRKEAYLRYVEQDLQREFFDYNQSSDLIPVTFFGFSETPIVGGDKKVNGKQVLENSISMYHQDFPLELSKQADFQVSLRGTVDAPIKFDLYDDGNESRIYPFEDGDFSVAYMIPEGVHLDGLELQMGTDIKDYMAENLWIYNRSTQAWDEATVGEQMNVENYLDENNLVEVKLHCFRERETGVPKLLIKGGGLFAGN